MELNLRLPVIGVVRTAHAELATTPIQAGLSRAEHGTIEIADRYLEGLDGLAEFDYAWLVSWLHRLAEPGSDPPLRQVPFLLRAQQREKGMFATRTPRRVNPIGLSLIQLLEVTGRTIRFAGVDLLDGTPVIDLKPYVARFDRPPALRDAAGTTASRSTTAPRPGSPHRQVSEVTGTPAVPELLLSEVGCHRASGLLPSTPPCPGA